MSVDLALMTHVPPPGTDTPGKGVGILSPVAAAALRRATDDTCSMLVVVPGAGLVPPIRSVQ